MLTLVLLLPLVKLYILSLFKIIGKMVYIYNSKMYIMKIYIPVDSNNTNLLS